jgi:hypothetical protein
MQQLSRIPFKATALGQMLLVKSMQQDDWWWSTYTCDRESARPVIIVQCLTSTKLFVLMKSTMYLGRGDGPNARKIVNEHVLDVVIVRCSSIQVHPCVLVKCTDTIDRVTW